jgi:hypothetical protein
LTDLTEPARQWKVEDVGWTDVEGILDAFTDETFETARGLLKYEHRWELAAALQRVISENRSMVVRDRKDCKKLCEAVNSIMREEHKMDPPRGWIPILKILKDGGPLQLPLCRLRQRKAAAIRKYIFIK